MGVEQIIIINISAESSALKIDFFCEISSREKLKTKLWKMSEKGSLL